jgi:rSAM/selenodomain-associated transferase 1
MSSQQLILFCKAPVHGKVKTRLADSIGDDKALELYTTMLTSTFELLNNVTRFNPVVFLSETYNLERFNTNHLPVYFQEGIDFESRLLHVMGLGFNKGDKRVVIGSDCPQISESLISQAFDMLDHNEAVIGPAMDGGFYLFGTRRFSELMFSEIPWSTSEVRNGLIKNLESLSISFVELPKLHDLDTQEDLNYFLSIGLF